MHDFRADYFVVDNQLGGSSPGNTHSPSLGFILSYLLPNMITPTTSFFFSRNWNYTFFFFNVFLWTAHCTQLDYKVPVILAVVYATGPVTSYHLFQREHYKLVEQSHLLPDQKAKNQKRKRQRSHKPRQGHTSKSKSLPLKPRFLSFHYHPIAPSMAKSSTEGLLANQNFQTVAL